MLSLQLVASTCRFNLSLHGDTTRSPYRFEVTPTGRSLSPPRDSRSGPDPWKPEKRSFPRGWTRRNNLARLLLCISSWQHYKLAHTMALMRSGQPGRQRRLSDAGVTW
jgi:hypothetical protein